MLCKACSSTQSTNPAPRCTACAVPSIRTICCAVGRPGPAQLPYHAHILRQHAVSLAEELPVRRVLLRPSAERIPDGPAAAARSTPDQGAQQSKVGPSWQGWTGLACRRRQNQRLEPPAPRIGVVPPPPPPTYPTQPWDGHPPHHQVALSQRGSLRKSTKSTPTPKCSTTHLTLCESHTHTLCVLHAAVLCRYWIILAERILRQFVATPVLGRGPRFVQWMRDTAAADPGPITAFKLAM